MRRAQHATRLTSRHQKLGLRAIATSRYSFGFWGAKLCSLLNIIVGGGYAVVNFVVVGQVLSAVSDYTMTITVGIVIIAVISYVISIFGFRLIHTFEKYSWIYTFVLLIVLAAQAAPHVDASIPSESSGLALAGSFLSILSINFCTSSVKYMHGLCVTNMRQQMPADGVRLPPVTTPPTFSPLPCPLST